MTSDEQLVAGFLRASLGEILKLRESLRSLPAALNKASNDAAKLLKKIESRPVRGFLEQFSARMTAVAAAVRDIQIDSVIDAKAQITVQRKALIAYAIENKLKEIAAVLAEGLR